MRDYVAVIHNFNNVVLAGIKQVDYLIYSKVSSLPYCLQKQQCFLIKKKAPWKQLKINWFILLRSINYYDIRGSYSKWRTLTCYNSFAVIYLRDLLTNKFVYDIREGIY